MTEDLTVRLRQEARRLLAEGEVGLVIGYQQGGSAVEVIPAFVTDPEATEALVFNSLCHYSPATYLKRGAKGRVAVVAKPCDTRALVSLIQEKQLTRDQLVVLAVPCLGVVDVTKFRDALGEDYGLVTSVSQEGQRLSLTMRGGDVRQMNLADILAPHCAECAVTEPVLADIRLDEAISVTRPAAEAGEGKVAQMATMPREERLRFWQEAFSRCIRCYACRNVCPVCFCEKCFGEQTMPQWVARSTGRGESELFHLVRFIHIAGRCTLCGECERVCPVKIPLSTITEKMNQDVKELFGYSPGIDPEEHPALARFSLEDLDIFGKG